MSECTLVERLPTPQEYNDLRAAVGWKKRPLDAVQKGLPNTLYCVCAYVNDELIGMARIIGDAGMVYYIQDVIVLPAYQHQGIGTQIMDKIMLYLQPALQQQVSVGLLAAPGKESFYKKYGFTSLPNNSRGAGMIVSWED